VLAGQELERPIKKDNYWQLWRAFRFYKHVFMFVFGYIRCKMAHVKAVYGRRRNDGLQPRIPIFVSSPVNCHVSTRWLNNSRRQGLISNQRIEKPNTCLVIWFVDLQGTAERNFLELNLGKGVESCPNGDARCKQLNEMCISSSNQHTVARLQEF
jgi:hypothetical protein